VPKTTGDAHGLHFTEVVIIRFAHIQKYLLNYPKSVIMKCIKYCCYTHTSMLIVPLSASESYGIAETKIKGASTSLCRQLIDAFSIKMTYIASGICHIPDANMNVGAQCLSS